MTGDAFDVRLLCVSVAPSNVADNYPLRSRQLGELLSLLSFGGIAQADEFIGFETEVFEEMGGFETVRMISSYFPFKDPPQFWGFPGAVVEGEGWDLDVLTHSTITVIA